MFPSGMMSGAAPAQAAGSGMAIGDPVTGAAAGRIPFIDTGPVLADNAALLFDKVTGKVSATALALSGLTSTRIPVAGAAGLLADFSTLTFTSGSGTLSATALQATGLTSGRLPVAGASGLLGDFSTLTYASSVLTAAIEDAGTATVLRPVVFRRTTSGTAAASLGIGLAFELEDSSGNTDSIGSIDLLWQDPANASEDGVLDVRLDVAGTVTDLLRLGGAGGVITAPDADWTLAVGRMLCDSRNTDTVQISHHDQTGTTAYGLSLGASGFSVLNAVSGQNAAIAIGAAVKWRCNGTSFAWEPGTDNAIDIGATTGNRARRLFLAEYWEGTEMTAPTAPAADKGRIFFQDNGAGKTQLMVIFATGAAQQIAIQP